MPAAKSRRGVRGALRRAFPVALPVMLGYVMIGLPAGILEAAVGIAPAETFLMSVTLYTGAGQFMIPNLVMAGQGIVAIVTSVSLVNTRQLLYSAAFAPWFRDEPKPLTALFSATVTDESFGVNVAKFAEGHWDAVSATAVNILSMLSWASANAVGALVGDVIALPTDVASFAMTSIFICLLLCQELTRANVVAAVAAIATTSLCKVVGLGSMAIIAGAVAGVALGLLLGGESGGGAGASSGPAGVRGSGEADGEFGHGDTNDARGPVAEVRDPDEAQVRGAVAAGPSGSATGHNDASAAGAVTNARERGTHDGRKRGGDSA